MRLAVPHTWSMSHEFACHAASCAPPPAGTGGSTRGADRRKAPRYPAPERRITSQQQHAMLIQQIRRDLEAANAKNRALRAAAKVVAANK